MFAVATGILSPSIVCRNVRSREVVARIEIDSLLTALDCYRMEVGAFPTEEQGLAALRVNPGVKGWNVPYLPRDIPRDPWGMPYEYRIVAGRPHVTAHRLRQ